MNLDNKERILAGIGIQGIFEPAFEFMKEFYEILDETKRDMDEPTEYSLRVKMNDVSDRFISGFVSYAYEFEGDNPEYVDLKKKLLKQICDFVIDEYIKDFHHDDPKESFLKRYDTRTVEAMAIRQKLLSNSEEENEKGFLEEFSEHCKQQTYWQEVLDDEKQG